MNAQVNDVCVIFNPKSGQGKKTSCLWRWMLGFRHLKRHGCRSQVDLAHFVQRVLEKHGKKVQVCSTKHPGHATELAKECLEFLKSKRVSETKSVLKRKYNTKKQ